MVVSGRREKEGEESIKLVEKAGGKCLFVKADVAIGGEIADPVDRTVEEFGWLDFGFNNACAAIIETDMTARIRGDEKLRGRFLALHPAGRFGQVEEVAAAVLYLCSPKAAFTTGVALPLDGGASA